MMRLVRCLMLWFPLATALPAGAGETPVASGTMPAAAPLPVSPPPFAVPATAVSSQSSAGTKADTEVV